MSGEQQFKHHLKFMTSEGFSVLDVLPESSLAEKIASILLESTAGGLPPVITSFFDKLKQQFDALDTSSVKVVVFGGGTGLSNIIGGDSRRQAWAYNPFTGLKEIFPLVSSVVCVTDDGGSTGELQKDVPLIALGDIRHVLVSSIRRQNLVQRYKLDTAGAKHCATALYAVFNYRFMSYPLSAGQLLRDTGATLSDLPEQLLTYLVELCDLLYTDVRLSPTLQRPQCLGNLLLAAAIYKQLGPDLTPEELLVSHQVVRSATSRGLAEISGVLGVRPHSVLPCTTTLSQLQMLYANGVLVTSEYKSGKARRGFPVDRVIVEFSRNPFLQPEVVQLVQQADIILFAPGSLYTSIIPILQVPGLAQAIRDNTGALKVLVANIWVQKGETDAARDAPDRKFYVSDLIRAYHRNIPGGVDQLFSHIVGLDLTDIPGSILQRYALEDKEPIFMDRSRVRALGFSSVEARIFAKEQLRQRGVIQHDPDALARVVKGLWALNQADYLTVPPCKETLSEVDVAIGREYPVRLVPCLRYDKIRDHLTRLHTECIASDSMVKMAETDRRQLLDRVLEILWLHPDIPLEHLQFSRGITLIEPGAWKRCQQWDNIYSFYDPLDQRIKVRQDQVTNLNRFEMVFLVALGQSLLGNYAEDKQMMDLRHGDDILGRTYRILVRDGEALEAFLTPKDIDTYLYLSKMHRLRPDGRVYTRVINPDEGFTPPGLFFGLFYAWYLDNRFAANIEYKMSIIRNPISDLIPEQVRIVERRRKTIDFFRERIFRQHSPFLFARER
ncbi:gluconeogenesis factor YvcK family protein [Desulfobulbus oligotrophicus]|uniref:YvcK family protein n=1 Tax=Desulfobulbus oligotrophicus TaxID=1909699 RepID=A0A7T5VF80_9BACT|nr:gluconeogenesis factor YvcK family protein [Desulfobulbus oligotrophicus]QQG66810.1 YvcK family protein [Desulfobulbus oligotrophicus]